MGNFKTAYRSSACPAEEETAITDSSSDLSHRQTPASELLILRKAKGHYWYPSHGPKILDACGGAGVGAGVACLGHGRRDIIKAVTSQMTSYTYASYAHFQTRSVQELSDWLIKSTGGRMQKVYVMCSGSEAMEAALKLSIEYFQWHGQPSRVNFIARHESYHGTTLSALSVSGHVARREPFHSVLIPARFHRIPACNPYRQRLSPSETDAEFVARKAAELEAEFARLGPSTVAAVVGAALGCVPAVKGYLSAVKAVCERHGALLVLDDVMCGMGRTGFLHAWQGEDEGGVGVVPDLQTIAKGFGGGYQPASALLVGEKVARLMEREGKVFTHGHTYQNHPVVAAAALAVQRVVEREGLLGNVRIKGVLLERLLRERLGGHPNVGDIRGKGLFWGVECVKDKTTKEPFAPGLGIAERVHKTAVTDFRVLVYHGQGCAGGGRGDHIMIMPAYDISSGLIAGIVERVACAVEDVFRHL
ncbi:pyridoxal phosphate-dependent transferase [Achaetomium macrosporum]|uniref:Pyridoxal phosphate-dependent transferase n=1 Tax=Achaetomium macrosporum TaxID=79813 RepID=A0AAN7C4W1_9PEZI|nr:pyridoxal phosphate-dependent transferase [Achaetomium macrosporum]